jgi:hypothetical protein
MLPHRNNEHGGMVRGQRAQQRAGGDDGQVGSLQSTDASFTVWLAAGEATGLADGEALGLATGEATGLADGEALGLAAGDGMGLAKGDGAGLATGDGMGLATGDGAGLATGDSMGLAKGDGTGLATGDGMGLLGKHASWFAASLFTNAFTGHPDGVGPHIAVLRMVLQRIVLGSAA